MATETTNYGLKKPDPSDFYSVEDFNGNSDKIDAALKGLANADETWKESAVGQAIMDINDGGNAATATKLKTARNIDGLKFDGSTSLKRFAKCDSAASAATKIVSVTDFTLTTGAILCVYFTNGISVDEPSLNVSSTGAKFITYRGKLLCADAIQPGMTVMLVYDGSAWDIVGELFCAGAAPEFFGGYDFDDFTVPGRYVCHVTPGSTWKHAPTGFLTSWLEVYTNQGSMTQVLKEYEGRYIYIRGYYESWSAWRRIASEAM